MSINKIFCLGDGYAHGHIWPEWPQILQALLPDYKIVTGTGIGAGNEFLIDQLLNFDCENQTVIFQWAQANRFDKLLQDQAWKILAKNDPVYHFNIQTTSSGTWWLSSASQNEKILEYHDFFVQDQQSKLRFKNQQILVKNYLQNKNCQYWFTSTQQQESFCKDHSDSHRRGNEVQPHPIMHYHFVIDCIKPALNLPIDPELQELLEKNINQTAWIAYDPNRKEIWESICKEIHFKHSSIINK
jgi:hypothetical protein